MKTHDDASSGASAATEQESPAVQIVGCTNPACQDHVGGAVAREISHGAPPGIAVAIHESHEFDVIADARRFAMLVLIQGVDAPDVLAPGDCRRLVYVGHEASSPQEMHELCRETGEPTGLSALCATLQSARERELLPDDVWVYAVGCGMAGGRAKTNAKAAGHIARRIVADVQQWLRDHQAMPH